MVCPAWRGRCRLRLLRGLLRLGRYGWQSAPLAPWGAPGDPPGLRPWRGLVVRPLERAGVAFVPPLAGAAPGREGSPPVRRCRRLAVLRPPSTVHCPRPAPAHGLWVISLPGRGDPVSRCRPFVLSASLLPAGRGKRQRRRGRVCSWLDLAGVSAAVPLLAFSGTTGISLPPRTRRGRGILRPTPPCRQASRRQVSPDPPRPFALRLFVPLWLPERAATRGAGRLERHSAP